MLWASRRPRCSARAWLTELDDDALRELVTLRPIDDGHDLLADVEVPG
jgi:hypothetical protein